MTRYSLLPTPLAGLGADDPFLLNKGRVLSVADFLSRVAAVRRQLDGTGAVINLCEHRPAFLVAYTACLFAGRTTLLPASRAAESIEAIRALYPDSLTLDDAAVALALSRPSAREEVSRLPVSVPQELIAMIGCTSGSTGVPSSHPKRWGTVVASTGLTAETLRAALPLGRREAKPWIVGTVPSQHMYGIELTVLLPLLCGMGLQAARPLLPAEIASVLEDTPAPRVLVSTPVHLRALVNSGVRLPAVDVTVCATAPLDADLARAVESCTGGVLLEMFGSTETCILAHRFTAREALWTPYPGVRFSSEGEGTRVDTPWFTRTERLQDLIEVGEDGCFRLIGRSADLVDVAGKRASLAELTQRLLRIPGVLDAVVFQPERARGGLVRRLAALVVAPCLEPADIRKALAPAIDPVFMPRPLVMLDALPRNASGKLPRVALEAALVAAGHPGTSAQER